MFEDDDDDDEYMPPCPDGNHEYEMEWCEICGKLIGNICIYCGRSTDPGEQFADVEYCGGHTDM